MCPPRRIKKFLLPPQENLLKLVILCMLFHHWWCCTSLLLTLMSLANCFLLRCQRLWHRWAVPNLPFVEVTTSRSRSMCMKEMYMIFKVYQERLPVVRSPSGGRPRSLWLQFPLSFLFFISFYLTSGVSGFEALKQGVLVFRLLRMSTQGCHHLLAAWLHVE